MCFQFNLSLMGEFRTKTTAVSYSFKPGKSLSLFTSPQTAT